MTLRTTGPICDGCGAKLPGDGIAQAAVLSAMDADGNVATLHYGLADSCGCAGAKLLTKAARGSDEAKALELYRGVDGAS